MIPELPFCWTWSSHLLTEATFTLALVLFVRPRFAMHRPLNVMDHLTLSAAPRRGSSQ
jgi:hypothetical protein